jgi:hypothetical protein
LFFSHHVGGAVEFGFRLHLSLVKLPFPFTTIMDPVGIAEKSTEQFVQFFYGSYDKQRNVSHRK